MFFCGARQVAFGAVNGKSVVPWWAEDSSYGVLPQGSPTCVRCSLGRSTSLPEISSGNKKILAWRAKMFAALILT